jgi:hypothetical protein
VQRRLQVALFAGLLLVGAYLRLTGLTWGLRSGYGRELNFQPDEYVSLRGVGQLDLLTGRIKAPGAYFEGTFNYYLWAVPQAMLKLAGKENPGFSDSTDTSDHADLLYISRWMSVLVDLCTIVVVFLAIREASQKFYPSVLGALCYAVIPMQVIYAHFMRTHIVSNLLCALVIWLSLKLRQSQTWQLFLLVGLISGLGAATRYPVGLIVVIPCLYLLFDCSDNLPNGKLRLLDRAKKLLARPAWLIGLGFGIGLFLGHPMLFLDPRSVLNAITGQTLKYASLDQFSGSHLLNLWVVWRYAIYLIPFAMYPILWVVPYCSIIYLLFRGSLYSLSKPILIFSLLYLYLMAKAYLAPYSAIARVTMLLFPGLCVLVGLVFDDLQVRLKNKRIMAAALTGTVLLLFVPSLVFDIAYGKAMQQMDAREALRKDLQNLIGDTPAKIGVLQSGDCFYTVMPAVRPLNSGKVTVLLQNAGENVDFFLIGFPAQISPVRLKATVRWVEVRGNFRYVKSYNVPVQILGHEFNLTRFPQDMTYTFPTILLFRARSPALSTS